MVSGILLWILSYFVPRYSLGLDESNAYSWSANIALNLLPNMALHYGYSIMSSYEERGKHLKSQSRYFMILHVKFNFMFF